jgi:hypothetical protein
LHLKWSARCVGVGVGVHVCVWRAECGHRRHGRSESRSNVRRSARQ